MTVVIGLTGSIATGKSTVSNMIRELNIPIVDADKIARAVVNPGENAYKQIVEAFGEEILQTDGAIDRKKLGTIVFSNKEMREKLNNIVHPEVRRMMLQQRDECIQNNSKAVVLDIPLLFESKLTHFVEKTLVVYVDEDVQLKRLMKRDRSVREEALQRMKAQIPVSKKAEMADAVINNNGTLEETREQLHTLLHKWDIL
ncbi:dephospho-CoA kinase [Salirhabdus euzebyi]|uniref:Dephospho-CoA kinase n=1 Tax=Salirhabdus euzebyi TaxID=394506 RepID=A0A841Q208_9BACI|nr:dephospho-CoA kinase [Salirhabdus euzebyi]MBB6452075.1 dephospho-CoA kinase [Salirhabdus euzebyi]